MSRVRKRTPYPYPPSPGVTTDSTMGRRPVWASRRKAENRLLGRKIRVLWELSNVNLPTATFYAIKFFFKFSLTVYHWLLIYFIGLDKTLYVIVVLFDLYFTFTDRWSEVGDLRWNITITQFTHKVRRISERIKKERLQKRLGENSH